MSDFLIGLGLIWLTVCAVVGFWFLVFRARKIARDFFLRRLSRYEAEKP